MAMNATDWKTECVYIAHVTDVRGNVSEFNHDRECFTRYCEMQRDTATREGFLDTATYIQHCIDDMTI